MQLSQGFTKAIQSYVGASEGGYVDHPKDPGGPTNHGVTQAVLSAWRGKPVSKAEVKALSKDEAIKIFKAQYWDTTRAEKMPLGLDYMVLDYGINSGPKKAIVDLQRTVGAGDDGVIGQKTLNAIEKFIEKHGLEKLLIDYANRRWDFVQGLKTFKTFGVGWRRRIWGEKMGVQVTDTGVVDRAVKLSQERYSEITMPLVSVGSALPEKPTYVDMLKDPTTLAGIAGIVTTITAAIQDQPVLQVAACVAVAFVVWRFVVNKKEADPA